MVLSLSSISFKPGSSNFVFFYWSALVYDFVDVSSPGKYLPHSWPRFVPHTWIGSTYVTRVCRPESTRAQKKPDACYAPELPLHGESSAPCPYEVEEVAGWHWVLFLWLGMFLSCLVWSCLPGIPEAVDILSLVDPSVVQVWLHPSSPFSRTSMVSVFCYFCWEWGPGFRELVSVLWDPSL